MEPIPLNALFTRPAYRRRLIACLILFMFQQLSGINAVMFYTEAIFRMSGSSLSPLASAALVAGIQVVAVAGLAPVVDLLGRRTYLLGSAAGMAACHAALGVHLTFSSGSPSAIPVLALLLYVLTFSVGFGAMPWLMVHELATPEAEPRLTAAAALVNWASGTLVAKAFGPAAAALGHNVVFLGFAGLCALAGLLVVLFVPETRFKKHHEIFPNCKL